MEEIMKIEEAKKQENIGKTVGIRGWVYRKRKSGKMNFIIMRDSTGIIQCVVIKNEVDETSWENSKKLYIESSVIIHGTVRKDERAKGGYELTVKKVEPISIGEPFLFSKDLSTEFVLDNRHLWLRSVRLTNIMKARHLIIKYLREFFDNKGFYEIAPPIMTKAGCEGGATLFPIKYFEDEAYLTQSSQMYAETMIFSLEKVYTLAPSFRMEPSRTVRHLAEYWHLEPEMAFYDNKMNMKLQEDMIEYVCQKMAQGHGDLLREIGRDPEYLLKIKAPFDKISYDKAIEILQQKGQPIKWGDDFGVIDERILTKELEKPIFIENFPKEIKAFYMKQDPNNEKKVICSDMLAPGGYGEIIGGSQREDNYQTLLKRMQELNIDIKDYKWYLDLRKYGSVPHSGFGLGVERLIMWMLNLDHIRDSIPYPRVINRVYP